MYATVPGFEKAISDRDIPLAYRLIKAHYQKSNISTAAAIERTIQDLRPKQGDTLQQTMNSLRYHAERFAVVVGQKVDDDDPSKMTWASTDEINDNLSASKTDTELTIAYGRILITNDRKFLWLDNLIRRHPTDRYQQVWKNFSTMDQKDKLYSTLCRQLENLELDNQQNTRLEHEKNRNGPKNDYSKRGRDPRDSRPARHYRANSAERHDRNSTSSNAYDRDRSRSRSRSRSRKPSRRFIDRHKSQITRSDSNREASRERHSDATPKHHYTSNIQSQSERDMRNTGLDRLKNDIKKSANLTRSNKEYYETECDDDDVDANDDDDHTHYSQIYQHRYEHPQSITVHQKAIRRIKEEIGERMLPQDEFKRRVHEIEQQIIRESELQQRKAENRDSRNYNSRDYDYPDRNNYRRY
jgi:hypothetical protein